MTIPHADARSILNEEDIWKVRQRAQWRMDYSKEEGKMMPAMPPAHL